MSEHADGYAQFGSKAVYTQAQWDALVAERDEARQQALDASRVGGGAMAEVARRGDLLRRLRQWDHMASAADGPYWIREIDAALGEDA